MDPFNSFFTNTNPNLQQTQFPLQPFTPTPNPRSRFPQNLSGAPGLIPTPSESFQINILPPENQVPLFPFPGMNPEGFHPPPHLQPSMPIQSPLTNMPNQPNIQTLQVSLQAPNRFGSPVSGHKILPRKKGFSVGTNQNQHKFQPGLDSGLRYFPPDRDTDSLYRRSFGISQEKGMTPTQTMSSLDFGQKTGSLKSLQLDEKDLYLADEILGIIEDYQINTVSMLNEVSSKIKKKVEYVMNETQTGKNRVFECICLMEKAKIGTGKGSSKQSAKTEAAKAAICTLVTKDVYAAEKHAILMSIQKSSSQTGSHSPSVASRNNIRPEKSSGTMTSDRGDVSPTGSTDADQPTSFTPQSLTASGFAHMNDSPLYELNVIAKECFIEPKWTLSPQPNQNGEFEVELRFEKLVAYGKGKKKQDAKRDAAVKIITQIRSSPELSERFNPKSKKQMMKNPSTSDSGPSDTDSRFFADCVRYNVFDNTQKKPFVIKEDLRKKNEDFETALMNLGQQAKLDTAVAEHFRDLFKKIADYTSMVTSTTKQVMIDAPKHIADYITSSYLIPVGSFALGCIRNEKLMVDCIMIFQELKEIEPLERLELYKQALEQCQALDHQNESNQFQISCKFAIQTNFFGNYLEVSNVKDNKVYKVCIYISDSARRAGGGRGTFSMGQKLESKIAHTKQIYDSFENLENELCNFRTLLIALRIWRDKNDLPFLCPEILDVILLNEFIIHRPNETASIVINCMRTLGSDDLISITLSRFGEFYKGLYNEIQQQAKLKIFAASKETLNNIFQGNLSGTKLF